MKRQLLMAVWVWMSVCRSGAMADLIITEPGKKSVIDFSAFTGAGFSASPQSGQLDSTTWRVGGFTDGTLDYGGAGVTGDFARGKSSGGVTSGGTYAFQVASGDWALGIQATGTDFNPGFIELRIANQTGGAIHDWQVGYDLYCRNDQARSSSWDVSYSANGSSFTALPELRYLSPEAATSNSFERNSLAWTIPIAMPNESRLYLRWTSADYAGTGPRDEFALDNVSIAGGAASVPEPGTFVLSAIAGMAAWGCRLVRGRTRLRVPLAACPPVFVRHHITPHGGQVTRATQRSVTALK